MLSVRILFRTFAVSDLHDCHFVVRCWSLVVSLPDFKVVWLVAPLLLFGIATVGCGSP
jgi:hypothetical protein